MMGTHVLIGVCQRCANRRGYRGFVVTAVTVVMKSMCSVLS